MDTGIVAFPLYRRRKLVNDVAAVLKSKHGEEATQFWRETTKTLLHQLSASGVALKDAEDQVRGLLYVVIAEMEANAELG